MTKTPAAHVRAVQDALAQVRLQRQLTRDAPDRQGRDAAIIAYSRALDALVEDLTALDDLGVLDACVRRLNAQAPSCDD